MRTLECDFAALTLFKMEIFPSTCMVAIPFRTPVGLGAQVLAVDASECDLRPLMDVLHGT